MMWEEMRFTNKKVLVTGASRGIGASISAAFRDEGAFVIGTQTQHNPSNAGENCHEWLVADFAVKADDEFASQCKKYFDEIFV